MIIIEIVRENVLWGSIENAFFSFGYCYFSFIYCFVKFLFVSMENLGIGKRKFKIFIIVIEIFKRSRNVNRVCVLNLRYCGDLLFCERSWIFGLRVCVFSGMINICGIFFLVCLIILVKIGSIFIVYFMLN